MDRLITAVIGFILLVVINVAVLNLLNDASCKAQWKDSGFEYRYSLIGGCQIKNKSGVWIPSGQYHEVAP